MPKRSGLNLTSGEKSTAFGLAGVYGVRMLGLFMILPVLALYVRELEGSTATLTGLAVGVYGLTQAIFQIPLGSLSDRIGRKKVIIGGLLIFALGSVVAALSTSITGIIIGRAIQGCGAIAAATLALAADLTHESRRTLVMAVIGISIGLAFAVSMVLGPLVQQLVGTRGIFWLTVVLAFLAMIIVVWIVPSPTMEIDNSYREEKKGFGQVLLNLDLQRLNLGIFVLHALLAANFVVFPQLLVDNLNMPVDTHWKIYLGVMVISILLMLPFVFIAERKRKMKPVFLLAILMLLVAQMGLYFTTNQIWTSLLAIVIFFVGFNVLEATLPSLVSKAAASSSRGAAMGVYSTTQFAGIFVGGLAGGLLSDHFSDTTPYIFGAVLVLFWLWSAFSMRFDQNKGRIEAPDSL